MSTTLPIDAILASAPAPEGAGTLIGHSREGRPLVGQRLGRGPRPVSLIAGCHADEPVGPAMLARLVGFLAGCPDDHPLLTTWTWSVVPHANPDGAARNAGWIGDAIAPDAEHAVDLVRYLREAVREAPGDDVEFGFPRDASDAGARPEPRAVADFLRPAGPLALHASFHGMAFAAGPWFLMERGWAERTVDMRARLRERVRALGYGLHDVDRHGDKGFWRIDEGFTSRPDSGAMVAHFEAAGDPDTARLFRPSSMEFARSLGGDPLTLVSEMPLFLLPAEHYADDVVKPAALLGLRGLLSDAAACQLEAARLGVSAMPVADQMRLQLAFLEEGLRAVG